LKKYFSSTSLLLFLVCVSTYAQDTLKQQRFSFHFQTTVVNQFKPAFHAPYTGGNSLKPEKDNQVSITGTLFAGLRLWKYASVFVNPEIAGGSGLSGALGVGASTNGETFRVGDPKPSIYLARLFIEQLIPLSKKKVFEETGFNSLGRYVPEKYLAITVGKISVADYFDDNRYSHDPRSQFLSWGLMSNGAWDYPANVRGYTPGVVLRFVSPRWELRYAAALMPHEANSNNMDWHINKSLSQSLEGGYNYSIHNRTGHIYGLLFFTMARMGSYSEALNSHADTIDITASRKYGRTKWGWGISFDQELADNLGMFIRCSWNDGRNETWAFTEIDRSISGGIRVDGNKWKRKYDEIGLGFVLSGLSDAHRNYLKAGGYGFILGDGKLNYGTENVLEVYYQAALFRNYIFLSGTYQFVLNPGYNIDRGPAHVLSVRLHVEI
jgi:high affinity Mn2+ porin